MSEKIVTIAGQSVELEVEHDGARYRTRRAAVPAAGEAPSEHEIDVVAVRGNEAELRVDGRAAIVPFILKGTEVWFALDGEIWSADVAEKGARLAARHREHLTSAPMPGIVLKILVKEGDAVTKGSPLLILEAMKMEHQIAAPYDGTVAAINCREGELVQPGIELIQINRS
jgi:3-methylcrotonyl-CoA carboxylase alpha subunit